ncbi:peptidoglycan DD-metalloendopeptidase family protein [Hylemonella gracilis]|nr:peptidoglycan DD-metalloendopeptidase family protein [Hylemonella gracilis]
MAQISPVARISDLCIGFFLVLLLALAPVTGSAQGKLKKRVDEDFSRIDTDDNDLISPQEWKRRGNFEALDQDGDGFLSKEEMAALYRAGSRGALEHVNEPVNPPAMDASYETDKIATSALDHVTLCGISRESCKMQDSEAQFQRVGLFETGLGPQFPKEASCLGIDDYFALPYNYKRSSSGARHGGMDMPAAWDTPILAAADGTVVGMYGADNSQRGREIVLRHAPEDTGLPVWLYTQYAHLNQAPTLKLGQRVRMGDLVGLTGNSGLSAQGDRPTTGRRPAIHYAAWFSDSRRYADTGAAIVPEHGFWLDPNGIYRGGPPFDSASLKALPENEKFVLIPVMYTDGTTQPANTRLIWPYTCTHRAKRLAE